MERLSGLVPTHVLAKVPKKFVAVAGAAALAYYVDQQLLLTSDLREAGKLGLAVIEGKRLLNKGTLVPDVFEDSVRKWPQKACIVFEGRSLSFAQVDAAANRVAHWAMNRGLRAGQTVALLMENRPEFVIVWLGLAKIGVVTALINTHLLADGLVHCVKISSADVLIVGFELLDKLAEVVDRLPGISFFTYGDGMTTWSPSWDKYPFAQSLDEKLLLMSPSQPDPSIRKSTVKPTDMALLIYTSGTTGLPKAARVTHSSVIIRALGFKHTMGVTLQDRIYCPLPLYHTSGGNLAVGVMMFTGATLCISRRFSTTLFWDEVRQYDCTIIQYIGEMCRYLMNATPKDNDKENHVRAAFGNGLRPDVWAPFQERFAIPAVYEFYGSTESMIGMINSCTRPDQQGHLGRRGALLNKITGSVVVKYDVEADDFVRDKNGHLVRCGQNETGELIGVIKPNDPIASFQGYYNNEKETNKKILHNVFAKGDAYVRTGDLFRIDSNWCWHFMDRVGDTFRWKGENVATNEVAETVSGFPGLSDICIYGVEVPGNEGRACLAAMVFDEAQFDMSAFAQHVQTRLPSYAVPLFLRQLGEMSVTGTMKHEKAKLRKEGMDPTQVSDRLWFLNKSKNTYERMTKDNYHQILTSSRL